MPATFIAYRCAGCGHWSHTHSTRPTVHIRREPSQLGAFEDRFWCGPYERFVCTIDDPAPPPDDPRIGRRVDDSVSTGTLPGG